MAKQEPEGAPRYSLKTLHALYDGSTEGSASAQGALRLTITDEDHHHFTAYVLSVGTQINVRLDDGTVRRDIKPAWVEHAEVV